MNIVKKIAKIIAGFFVGITMTAIIVFCLLFLWFATSCDRGNVSACGLMSLLHNNMTFAISAPSPHPDGNKLYLEKGCDLNSGMSCYYLAYFWYNGRGGVVDKQKAYQYFNKACELKYEDPEFMEPISCDWYASYLWNEKADIESKQKALYTVMGLCDQRKLRLSSSNKTEKIVVPLGACWLSVVYNVEMGNIEIANRYFRKTQQIPIDKRYYYLTARYYNIFGDVDKSLDFLRKAVEYDDKYRKEAKTDKNFMELWGKQEFKNIVGED